MATLLVATHSAAEPLRLPGRARRSSPACGTAGHHAQRHPRRRAGTAAAASRPIRRRRRRSGSAATAAVARRSAWASGLLASWQSRSIRDLAARQAPYAAAHQLMASSTSSPARGRSGLDSAVAGRRAGRCHARRPPGCARSAVFVVEPDDSRSDRSHGGGRRRRALADGDRARRRRPHPRSGRRAAARRATRRSGYCVLVGVPRWTPSSTSAPRRWPTSSRSASTPPSSSTTCAAGHRRRSATGSPARCTTASPRRSSRSATSSTRSSRSATRPQTRELAVDAARRDHPAWSPRSASRSSTCATRSTDGRLSGALADYVREVSHATGLRVHLSLDESGPPLLAAHRDRAAARRAGGHRQRPQARPRRQPVGHPRLRRRRRCASRSRTTASATPRRATATGDCRPCASAPTGIGADLDVSAPTGRRNRRQPAVTRCTAHPRRRDRP